MRTEKNIFYKKLTALVFPIVVQNLMTALVSASDALMLGFLNQTSLPAVYRHYKQYKWVKNLTTNQQ